MNRRKTGLWIGIVVLTAALIGAGVVFAQEAAEATGDEPMTVAESTFQEKVAAHLGISVDELNGAIVAAHLESIDEAVAAGRLTEEQAAQARLRIEAQQSLQDLIEQGLASGELTEDEADLLMQRGRGATMFGARSFGGAGFERRIGDGTSCDGESAGAMMGPRGMRHR